MQNSRLDTARKLLKEASERPQQAAREPSQDDMVQKLLARLKNYAIKKLAVREHSAHDIRSKLLAYIDNWLLIDPEVDDATSDSELGARTRRSKLIKNSAAHQTLLAKVDALVAELAEQGYQSDERTTQALLRTTVYKGQGRKRLLYSLKRQQLDAGSIADELQTTNWLKQAILTRQKRFGKALPTAPKEKARQLRFLQYRGFEADVCYKAIRTTLHDIE